MSKFEDLVSRQKLTLKSYINAVAGLRALASTGVVQTPNPNLKRSIGVMKAAALAQVRAELLRYRTEHETDDEGMNARIEARFDKTMAGVESIVEQIATKTTREGTGANVGDVLNRPAGALGLLVQRLIESPRYHVKDSADRTWEAEKLFGVIVRDFAYQTEIDRAFADAISAGQDKVTASDGTVIELSQDWLAKRDEVFHINSKKVVDDGVV